MSRWSASPSRRFVRQVPHVPLSQDQAVWQPCSRATERMDFPIGTSNSLADFASFTVNGLSSGWVAPPSEKLSKCTLAGDQCPVMSRTASISLLGPQQ
ncbi:hypothetical protein D3C71_1878270 [compost metagenome]